MRRAQKHTEIIMCYTLHAHRHKHTPCFGESTFLHLEAFRVFKRLDGSLETGSAKALNAPFPRTQKKNPSNSLIYDILNLLQSEEFVELC